MYFSAGSFPDAPQLETRMGLLLIDLQYDFIATDGKLLVSNVQEFLPQIPDLAYAFRKKGDVVWIRTEFLEPRPSVSEDLGCHIIVLKEHLDQNNLDAGQCLDKSSCPSPVKVARAVDDPEAFLAEKMFEEARCCVPGSPGAEFPSTISSAVDAKRDKILTKTCYSAFHEGSLLQMLRAKLITELYLCGSLSNISIYATALDAVRHGFAVTVVEDCVGFRNEKCHAEALRRMADAMGANGIEMRELMDDLNGNLIDDGRDGGTEDYLQVEPRPYEPRAHASSDDLPLRPKIQDWLLGLDKAPQAQETVYHVSGAKPSEELDTPVAQGPGSPSGNDSFVTANEAWQDTPDPSTPPRKRSMGQVDFEERKSESIHTNPRRRSFHGTMAEPQARAKSARIRVRRRALPGEQRDTPIATGDVATFIGQNLTIAPLERTSNPDSILSEDENVSSLFSEAKPFTSKVAKPRRSEATTTSGLGDLVGEGDSRILYDFISDFVPVTGAAEVFGCLRHEVKWQQMYHRSGEVPRLVAVQGEVGSDDSVPIYRHPADEPPPLLAFSPLVQLIREHVEREVQHPINHVLIQLYRGGEDNISEHSDKTLDIVRGSVVVNYSVGAMRTMTLRTKRPARPSASSPMQPAASHPGCIDQHACDDSKAQRMATAAEPEQRTSQRIPLPHNSLFILGQATNQKWLHAIRADKRREHEKLDEELAFNCERISLTFRHIGTFVDPATSTIWGQGAKCKDRNGAGIIPVGDEMEKEGEMLVRAFGQENQQSEFDWDEHYGGGFDVVSFVTKAQPQ